MVGVVIAVVAGVLLTAALIALPWVMPKWRQRHSASLQYGAIEVLDEIYRPNGHEMKREWEAQTELPAPAPDAGDKTFPDGKVTIQL